MAKTQPASPLQAQIDRLEQQRLETLHGIKSQLRVAGNSLKPSNIVRDAAQDIISSTDIKKLALKAAGTIAIAFILKQILQKNKKQVDEEHDELSHSESFWDRTLSTIMQFAGPLLAEQLQHVGPFLAEQFTAFVRRHKNKSSNDQEDDETDRESDMAT